MRSVIDDELPPFDLPDWDRDSAWKAARIDAEDRGASPTPGAEVEPSLRPVIRLSTLPLGGADEIGLVASEGSAEVGDDAGAALGAARMAALDRLVEEAGRLGATAVVAVRLSPAMTKRRVAVLAYGTAVRAR